MKKGRKDKVKIKKGWYALFVVPILIPFVVTVIIPFFQGVRFAFVDWNGMSKSEKIYVGFQNFINVFKDPEFMSSMGRTTMFTLITVVLVNVLALAFAVWVTSEIKFKNPGRAMLFMPYLIGGLILGYVWKYVLGQGMTLLAANTGNETLFFNWLSDPNYAFYAMIVVATWQMAGYMMVIYIAGLEAISGDVLEASKIDGANGWKEFIHIKLPLLMPSITICLFLTLSNCFKIYDVNVSLTGGGPAMATEMISMNIYNEIFVKSNFGFGQAKAIVFFLIVAVITFLQVRATSSKEVEI